MSQPGSPLPSVQFRPAARVQQHPSDHFAVDGSFVKSRAWVKAILMAGSLFALAALWTISFGAAAPRLGLLHLALGSVAVVLLAALSWGRTLRAVLAGVCCAVISTIYLCEIVLSGGSSGAIAKSTPVWNVDRTSPARRKEVALARERGVEIDLRDAAQVLADLREQGVDAVPAVMIADSLQAVGAAGTGDAAPLGSLLPMGSISNRVTVLCNESGRYVTYESDEHGFRNPLGIWRSARADLAAVGQSLTQGYCVPDGKGFVDLLRARHPVTLNLGMSGESALLQLGAIKEYLPRYAPKVVLWFFSEEIDLPDLYAESTYQAPLRYLEPEFTQYLLDRQVEIDAKLRHFVAQREKRAVETTAIAARGGLATRVLSIIKLWNLREKLELVYGIKSDSQPWSMTQRPIRELLSRTLAQAQAVTQGWNGALYFVYLPSWNRYRNGARVPERERGRVLHLVRELGIPIIDVQPAFEAYHDPLALFPFRRFGHYNEAGNQIVADSVLRVLAQQGHQ